MSNQDREKRRQKKLQKQRLKRKGKSRPGRDQTTPGRAGGDPKTGLGWPAGPCWLSDGWHERGATVQVVMTRVHESGRAIAGLCTVDLRSEGTTEAKLVGGLSADQLAGVAARVSEDHEQVVMLEVSPAQAAAVLVAGVSLSPDGKEAALCRDLIGDLDPADAPLDVLTGKPDAPPPEQPEGWFSRLVEKLVGRP
jgi:hypothetical protein